MGSSVSTQHLQVGDRVIDLSSPVVMGILNVTPDSFSDGGSLGNVARGAFRADIDKALKRAQKMVDDGAAFIDVGGESTRPGAERVSEQEELDRVIPVVEAIASRLDVVISVDTSTPSVMRHAIGAGAGLINDVRALTENGARDVLASYPQIAICLMHMRGQPATMQKDLAYADVVEEVMATLRDYVTRCEQAGISRHRLLLDPGFGFGKSPAQNFTLLNALQRFQALGLPLLIGVSRKSMLGVATGREVQARVSAGVAATMVALEKGARIIRTHDVADTVDAVAIFCALQGELPTKG